MGRSVSYATGSVARVYYDVSNFGYTRDDDGNRTDQYDEAQYPRDWIDFINVLSDDIKTLWPSFSPCDKWLGKEDKAFMENGLAYIGISEYRGLACLWLVPKEDGSCYPEDIRLNNLAKGFCSRITKKFTESFGDLQKVRTFSDGSSIYERKAG